LASWSCGWFCILRWGCRSLGRAEIVACGRSLEVDAEGGEASAASGLPRCENEGSGRCGLLGDDPAVTEYEEAAVEEFAEFDARPGACGARWQLHEAAWDRDGGVAGHGALIAAREGAVELAGRWAPGVARIARGHGEAPAEVLQECRDESERGLDRGDAAEAHFGGEAVVEGSPEALDAALGLRGSGGDVGDGELFEGLAELGGSLPAGELFFHGPVIVIAHEGAEAVAVEFQGQARSREHLAEGHGVSVEILVRAKGEGHDGAGGVVLGGEGGEPGAVLAEPGVLARIEENPMAGAGLALSAPEVAGRAAPVLGWAAELEANASHAGA